MTQQFMARQFDEARKKMVESMKKAHEEQELKITAIRELKEYITPFKASLIDRRRLLLDEVFKLAIEQLEEV